MSSQPQQSGSDAPAFIVLWRFADTCAFTTLWLGDERDIAEKIAAQPAPALEPGETVLCELRALAVTGERS